MLSCLSRPADSEGWLHAAGADRQRSRCCPLWQLAREIDERASDVVVYGMVSGAFLSLSGQPMVTVCHRGKAGYMYWLMRLVLTNKVSSARR